MGQRARREPSWCGMPTMSSIHLGEVGANPAQPSGPFVCRSNAPTTSISGTEARPFTDPTRGPLTRVFRRAGCVMWPPELCGAQGATLLL
jgi:hypothetical protein